MDPHSENYYSWSPYVYCGNNPMRIIDPTGKDWRDFLNGIANGAQQRAEGYANLVAHPIETIVNMATGTTPSLGEAIVNAVDNLSMGSISTTTNAVQAVASDLNGGNGSAIGQFIGGVGADVGASVTSGLAFQAAGKAISVLSKSGSSATLYRGVNSQAGSAFDDALQGIAQPRGGTSGHTNASLHNTGTNGTVNSAYTSWTTNYEVAKNFALRVNGQGVVLEKAIPLSSVSASPNLKSVNLIQSPGVIVSESEKLVKGVVKNATITPVKLP